MSEHFDVVIIGSGAGGGTLAHKVAREGLRVAIVERGDFVPREKENWDARAVNVEGRYHTKEVWRDGEGRPLHPHTSYNVGGNTKFYGAALFRMREKDFGELRHHGGVSPAWPISYADLAPYYDEAERLYHVHGVRGEDPTDPPAGPYPYPAVRHEPAMQTLADDFANMGLKPFHVPLGVMLDESSPNTSRCIKCNTCDGFPCLLKAKADAAVCCIETILDNPNVKLLTNTKAERIETDASGRVAKRVIVSRVTDGKVELASITGEVIVVAAGAINSAALLLRSKSEQHPKGLANGSDMVGRHYMGHLNSVLMAISKDANPTVFQKTLGVNDFYFGDGEEFPHPMGHISFVGKLDGVTLSAGAPAIAPGWTLDMMAGHSFDFWLTSEDLPDPENRVTINDAGEIVLTYKPNNEEGHKRLVNKLETLMQSRASHHGVFARNLFVGQRIPLAGVAHQNGTIRFGKDPKTSVLDPNCKAHELDNLYVADASFFASSGAVNPALTVMANALRVGDHLVARLAK